MKFTVEKSELLKGLQRVSTAVPSKSTLPILGNILFKLQKNKLTLTATDLEISLVSWLQVKGEDDGTIAIPSKIINDIIRELPETSVSIKTDDNQKITLQTSSGVYKISGEKEDEFPTLPEIEESLKLSIDGKILKRMINKTIFATSNDELRPALMGVLLQLKDGEFRAVATDGHRLVKVVNKEAIKKAPQNHDVIIPTKALNLILKNLKDDEQNSFIVSENHVVFNFSDTTLYSRIINEPYPDYERVIPTKNNKRLTINRDSLQSSVKRVGIFSNPVTHQIRFSLKKDKLEVSAEDVDFGGEAKETVECQYNSEQMDIGYNANYVLDLLKHIETDEVIFDLNTPTTAAIVYPSKQMEGEEMLMLLMPVRLND